MKFSQGEIQQLQEVLSSEIRKWELEAEDCKEAAKTAKKCKLVDPEWEKLEWREFFKAKVKINKLAELQRKLKRAKWSLVEVEPWVFDEDREEF